MQFKFLWRLLAALAIVLYLTVAYFLARFVLHHTVLILLFFTSLVIFLYCSWLVFSRRKRRVTLGKICSLAGLLLMSAELIYFLRSATSLFAILGFLLASILYVLLIRFLRNKYWQQKRQTARLTKQAAQFRNPYLIVNPKSGNGRAIKANIPQLATAQGIHVVILKKGDSIEKIAESAVTSGADIIGISGGDGSIGAVVKVALVHNLPIVVLPGGTRCHFARDIGLDPKRITEALHSFDGVERRIDVGDINGRIFLNNVSFGLYADIVSRPDYRENKMQVSREVLRSLASGDRRPYDLRFHHGQKLFTKAIMVLVACNPYKTLNLFELGRREKLDAGVLQVTSVLRLSGTIHRQLLKTVSIDALANRMNMSDLQQWEATDFRLTSSKKRIVVGVDGEREIYATPVHVRLLPKTLSVYVPAEGIRNRPKNPFSLFIFGELWHALFPGKSDDTNKV